MRKLIGIFLISMLVACSGTDRLIESRKYDEALDELVKSLQKKPLDQNKITQLDQVLNESVRQDLAHIERLKLSGQPDIWSEVLQKYQSIIARQEKSGSLADTTTALMQFKPADYSDYIAQASIKATQYHYALALKQLESENLTDVQKAYENLLKVKELTPGYKDSDELLAKFVSIEPVQVFYTVTNRFSGYLPPEQEDELLYLDLTPMNTPFYNFHYKQTEVKNFHYKIAVDIFDVKIIPENTREANYVETAKVQDGIAYQLDASGNFIYDENGNKIEYPKLKTIACYVTETIKEKAMLIGGSVEIRDAVTEKIVGLQSITGESRFSNRSAIFKGDINALAPETFELLGTKEMEYPSDLEMILRASDKFKINAVNYIIGEIGPRSPKQASIE